MPKTGRLTDQKLRDFNRDGYVLVRGMFSPVEMAQISGWTADLESRPESPGEYMMYYEQSLLEPRDRILQRIENFYPYHTDYRALLDGVLRDTVGQLFDEAAVLFKDKINLKKSGGEGFKPHQDQQAGWGNYAGFFISAMVSIDAATVDNGCLQLVPSQHKQGLIGEEWAPLDEDQMTDMEFVDFPTKPGDVVFFDSYAPHGSGPNLTDQDRRILYVTYNRQSEGDHRAQYFADKRESYPPDIEREVGKEYVFRV